MNVKKRKAEGGTCVSVCHGRCEQAMKTAGRRIPNRWAPVSSNRAPGAAAGRLRGKNQETQGHNEEYAIWTQWGPPRVPSVYVPPG
jgi:hypothetical protein